MTFWDSSAIIPLLVKEALSDRRRVLLANDPEIAVWWATEVECVSALERRLRDRTVSVAEGVQALQQLTGYSRQWTEVAPTVVVRARARTLLSAHAPRAADALQLAAGSNPCIPRRTSTASLRLSG